MRLLLSIFLLSLGIGVAHAQGPGPQPDPWILSGTTINPGTYKVVTAPSTTAYSGFNIPIGVVPSSPINGDIWNTSSGMFIQSGGITIGPLIGVAQLPLGTNSSVGVVQCDGDYQLFVSGVITAVGAVATSIGVGTTTITSGTTKGMLYDNGGVLGNLATANNAVLGTDGSGNPSMSTTLPSGLAATNLALTTPTLGVASGTSLALGGATIGGNALAVTGTVLFNTPLSLASGGTAANLTASNGGVVFSSGSALEILAGTPTPGLCLLSGSNTIGTWGACTGSAAVASVGNAAADTTTTIGGTGSGPYTGAVTVAINLANVNIWTGAQTFSGGITVSTSFTATGLVTTAALASKTGSGTTVVLSTSPSIATPTITGSFTATGLVTVADLAATSGSGNVVLTASPSISNLTVTGSLTATGLVTTAALASKTGSGTVVVLQSSPSITTPTISTPTINGTMTVTSQMFTSGYATVNGSSGIQLQYNGTSYLDFNDNLANGWYMQGLVSMPNINSGPGNYYMCWANSGRVLANNTCITSALRFKTQRGFISPEAADIGLDKLRPAIFTYKDPKMPDVHVGLYADDVEKMDNRCTTYDDNRHDHDDLNSYEDRCVIAYLVAWREKAKQEMKSLKAEVDTLRATR